MPPSWSAFCQSALARLDDAQLRRRRIAFDPVGLLDFGSNDYLGLRSDPNVLDAARAALEKNAWGTGASPVLSGYGAEHEALERALGILSDADAALVFSSGFACNSGTVACLAGSNDLILSDQLNHASLIDGCRLSKASKRVYRHCDVAQVRELLRGERGRFEKVMILTESVFSMDGDAAPLSELAELSRDYDCGLVVDEAHAVGVYGEAGGGLLDELGLQHQSLAKLGTLSKALGSIGGYVCGDSALIEYIVNHCRSYLFSTSPPAAAMAAARAAIARATCMTEARGQLRQTARKLRTRLASLGLAIPAGDSPIIPVILGSEAYALHVCSELMTQRIYSPAIRPPTVPAGTSRLRISLSVKHSQRQIDDLLAALQSAL